MPEEMQAIVVRSVGGPEVLELSSVPIPEVGPADVRVAVKSIAINFRDVQQRRMPAPDAELPTTPGSDFAGEIVETGTDVESFQAGDRVFGITLNGAYAQQIVIPAVMAMPLPPGANFDTAAILPVAGLTASFLLTVARIEKGQTAVTYAAAGGLGCFLGGLLADAGVRSIGLTSTEAKAAVARAAGHSEVVNYRTVDPVQAVRDLTDGSGADVVFDSVAGPEFSRSFRMLRNEGTVVLCGRSAGDPDLAMIHDDFIAGRRNLAMREFYLATHVFDHLDQIPQRLQDLAAAIRDGRVIVPVTTFPLAEVQRAHMLLERGETTGKLVLRP
jgi:NADPH2:quinone reductase